MSKVLFAHGRILGLLLVAALLWPAPAGATAPALSGELPAAVSDAFASGLFSLPPAPQGLPTSAVTGEFVLPIIRVAYSDSALAHTAGELEHSLFDSTASTPDGSLTEYYLWASGGRLRVRGRVVASVVLPHDRYYYSFDGYGLSAISAPNNSAGLAMQAAQAADPSVDWNEFDRDHDGYVDMVWIVHAGPGAETSGNRRDLWSITSRLSTGWSNVGPWPTDDLIPGTINQHVRIDRFTILPELSGVHPGGLNEIGIFCHEFGHTLGLPDLYDTASLGGAQNSGPGIWSLMSTGAYGADGRSPQRPTNLGAWPLLFLGWANRLRLQSDSTVVLPAVAAGGPVLEMWSCGEESPEHFLIEQRERSGFDRDVPSAGLLLYQIDEALVGARLGSNRVNYGPFPALRVIEADGRQDLIHGWNRGEASDPLPGSLGVTSLDDDTAPSLVSLTGSPTNLALRNVHAVGSRTSADVRVLPFGWGVPRQLADDAAPPTLAFGPFARTARGRDGREWLVAAEDRGSLSRIVLRQRTGDTWGPGLVLDDGSEPAAEPVLAALPGGDLVAAWTSGTGSNTRIRVRTRVAGGWGAPVTVSPAGQLANSPSLAADGRGRVCAAWLGRANANELQQVWFLRFVYLSPGGQPTGLTPSTALPGAPQVVCEGSGNAYVIWSERSVYPAGLQFSRCPTDSVPTPPIRLVNTTGNPQLAFSAVVDSAGTLHTIWQVSGAGVSEIHWQRRPKVGALSPRDTTIDAQGEGLRDPYLTVDSAGTLHATWMRSQAWGSQVRYDRWRPDRGWDFRSSALTFAADGNCDHAALVPEGPDEVTVVYLSTTNDATTPHSRRRSPNPTVADAPPTLARAAITLAASPNPVRAGAAFTLRGARPGERVELFDAQGRRLAAALAGADARLRVGGSLTSGWPSGLYFARASSSGATARFVVVR